MSKIIQSISDIISQYDVFILDQWGVMHDGKIGYSHAINCINYLKSQNKKLVIISNSSKRKKTSMNRLPVLGFNSDSFDELITSGEMIWQEISKSLDKYGSNLKKCFHMFENEDGDGEKFVNGLHNIEIVNNIEEADFILGCTPYKNYQPIDYIPLLNQAYEKNLVMFCANPDFETVEKIEGKNVYCMGTIAQLYEDMGGNVVILGKPSLEIYNKATILFNDFKKSQIIAIGDSIFHDILGANKFGIDSILITSGIHVENFSKHKPIWKNERNKLLKYNIEPTYICKKFCI